MIVKLIYTHCVLYDLIFQIERPFTNNPVIPLLDCVYDHVIKRYPKRSFCILRNCVRVSDLLRSTKVGFYLTVRKEQSCDSQDTVFELVRPPRAPSCQSCSSDPLATEPSLKGRLRPKSRGARVALRSAPSCSCVRSCCSSLATTQQGTSSSTGPGSGATRAGNRRSMRGGDVGASSSGANAAPVFNGTGLARVEESVGAGRGSSDRWVFAPRAPDKRTSGSSCRKSGELISLLEQEEVNNIINFLSFSKTETKCYVRCEE